MSSPFTLAMLLIALSLGALLLWGEEPTILGLDPDSFARFAYLAALAIVVGSGVLLSRHPFQGRLWHAAVWLALFTALVLGYTLYHRGDAPLFVPDTTGDTVNA